VSFSPAGDRFAYVELGDVNQRLMLANRDGQHAHALLSVSGGLVMLIRPAWSPDGKRIAVMLFSEHPHSAGEAILDLIDMQGRESRRMMPGWQRIGQLRWTPDGKSIVLTVGADADPNKPQIHQVSIPTGTDRVLINDLAAYSDVSVSANGELITAIKTDSKAVVWVSKRNDFTHGITVPAQAERDPSVAWADGEHLILDSRRNGFPNLALLDLQTQAVSAFTNEHYVEQAVATVPSSAGRSVVFASNRSGEFHIWRFDPDNNQMQQLTFGSNYDERPCVSPDGQWVVYTSWAQNMPHLMKVRANGGPASQIGSYAAEDPQISPDGKWIACYFTDPVSGKWSVALVPFAGAGQPKLIAAASTPFRWSPNGASLTTTRTNANGVSNLWRVPLNGSPPVQLTDFEDQSIAAFSWSPSGDRLACMRVNTGADVALFKNTDSR
jgi:TolB protein